MTAPEFIPPVSKYEIHTGIAISPADVVLHEDKAWICLLYAGIRTHVSFTLPSGREFSRLQF
jgi:hypothetical protein